MIVGWEGSGGWGLLGKRDSKHVVLLGSNQEYPLSGRC